MNANSNGPVAMISSYVPRRCGIATFANNLATALAGSVYDAALSIGGPVRIVAVSDHEENYQYGPEVEFEIRQHRKDDYRNAADFLNDSKVTAVNLQHEYGLFGGDSGAYLLEFLKRLKKPVVSTLHTVLAEPTDGQRDVLARICERSHTLVVMAERARTILNDLYSVPRDRIRLIHHGAPDMPFGDTEPFKERFDVAGRPMILTFGLLSPSKGIEVMLDALAEVVPDHPDVAYIVLGATHPHIQRDSGESYRMSLESRALERGIQKNVMFHNRYVVEPDLCEYLEAADIYVTPYLKKDQITSGTLAYAVASGTAVISTPYWYAQELLADGRGQIVPFNNVPELATALRKLLDQPKLRARYRRAAYDFGRDMIWPSVAREYADALALAAKAAAVSRQVPAEERPGFRMRLSLPEVRLDHFLAMTDDTGMLQHAVYSTPDRRHGYATDDNARAIIVACMDWTLFEDERVLVPLQTCLSFLHDARPAGGGRFRGFMTYDRQWLEMDWSEDCQGRVLWALGYLISHAPRRPMRLLAEDLFRAALPNFEEISSPRAWALAMLGLYYYLREFENDGEAIGKLSAFAGRLNSAFVANEAEEWPWFEDVVTYDNGRLPQALILAGLALDDDRLKQRGLRVLSWLLKVQTADDGRLSVIGNNGWLRRDGQRATYDQQPLEPAGLIGACKAAHRATGDERWLVEMRRCFAWFLGHNDAGLPLVDFKSHGCHDGLLRSTVNSNQGAESCLVWLHSLLIMHETQTGEALDVAVDANAAHVR